MKLLAELKQEIKTVIDDRIKEINRRGAKKGNLIIDKLNEINAIISVTIPDNSSDYKNYYAKISKAIKNLDFLKNLSTQVKTHEMFQKHLRDVKKLIEEKEQEEIKALEFKKEQEQVTALQVEKENESVIALEVEVEKNKVPVITLEVEKEEKQPDESYTAEMKTEQNQNHLQESQLPEKKPDDAEFKKQALKDRNLRRSESLHRYATQLRKDDWIPSFLSFLSIKAYKAKGLDSLGDKVQALNNDANLSEDTFRPLVIAAKKDAKLVRGSFFTRTRNLLENLLDGNEDNYINSPINRKK